MVEPGVIEPPVDGGVVVVVEVVRLGVVVAGGWVVAIDRVAALVACCSSALSFCEFNVRSLES